MSDRIVVNPGDLESTAKVMGSIRGELQMLARKVTSDANPEMPPDITARVRTGTAHVSVTLYNRSNELEQVAGGLLLRAMWAQMTSGYETGLGKRATLSELRQLRKLISNVPLLVRMAILPSTIYGYFKFLPFVRDWNSWVKAGVPVEEEGGQLTLASVSRQALNENHPGVLNNSWLGRWLAANLPEDSYLAKLLGNASRATPFFRVVGTIGGVAATAYGGYSIVRDIQLHKSKDKLAVDATGTAFSASTVAALMLCAAGTTSEIPPLAVAIVIATGVMYGGAEAWQHRKTIEHAAVWYWEHATVDGLAYHYRHEIGHVLDKGTDIAGSTYNKAKDLADSAYDWAIG